MSNVKTPDPEKMASMFQMFRDVCLVPEFPYKGTLDEQTEWFEKYGSLKQVGQKYKD